MLKSKFSNGIVEFVSSPMIRISSDRFLAIHSSRLSKKVFPLRFGSYSNWRIACNEKNTHIVRLSVNNNSLTAMTPELM